MSPSILAERRSGIISGPRPRCKPNAKKRTRAGRNGQPTGCDDGLHLPSLVFGNLPASIIIRTRVPLRYHQTRGYGGNEMGKGYDDDGGVHCTCHPYEHTEESSAKSGFEGVWEISVAEDLAPEFPRKQPSYPGNYSIFPGQCSTKVCYFVLNLAILRNPKPEERTAPRKEYRSFGLCLGDSPKVSDPASPLLAVDSRTGKRIGTRPVRTVKTSTFLLLTNGLPIVTTSHFWDLLKSPIFPP